MVGSAVRLTQPGRRQPESSMPAMRTLTRDRPRGALRALESLVSSLRRWRYLSATHRGTAQVECDLTYSKSRRDRARVVLERLTAVLVRAVCVRRAAWSFARAGLHCMG